MKRHLSIYERFSAIARSAGLDPLAIFEMTALEFAARLRAARQGRMS